MQQDIKDQIWRSALARVESGAGAIAARIAALDGNLARLKNRKGARITERRAQNEYEKKLLRDLVAARNEGK